MKGEKSIKGRNLKVYVKRVKFGCSNIRTEQLNPRDRNVLSFNIINSSFRRVLFFEILTGELGSTSLKYPLPIFDNKALYFARTAWKMHKTEGKVGGGLYRFTGLGLIIFCLGRVYNEYVRRQGEFTTRLSWTLFLCFKCQTAQR